MSTTAEPIDHWQDDKLDRKYESLLLRRFVLTRLHAKMRMGKSPTVVLNIDGTWGQGKTFFLSRMAKDWTEAGYTVALVNAWEEDFAEDPLLPVMAAISQATEVFADPVSTQKFRNLRRNAGQIAGTLALGVVKQAVRKYAGEAGSDAMELAGAGVEGLLDKHAARLLDDYTKITLSMKDFRRNLEDALEEAAERKSMKLPLIVLIDELDRCRPDYAIRCLERVKHLFAVENLVFIFATDTSQLAEAIKTVYGFGFDSTKYLGRFFDRTYKLRKQSRLPFISEQIALRPDIKLRGRMPDGIELEDFITSLVDKIDLPTRDVEQVLDLLSDIIVFWEEKAAPELVYLVPLVVAYQVDIKIFRVLAGRAVAGDALPNAWKEWQVTDIHARHNDSPFISGHRIMEYLLDTAKTPWKQLGRRDNPGPWHRWAEDIIRKERLARGDEYRLSPDAPSVIVSYPDHVQSLSRGK